MDRGSQFLTYFDDPAITLDTLTEALAFAAPVRRADSISVPVPGTKSRLQLWVSDRPHVVIEAAETAQRKKLPGIATCSRRVECVVEDLEGALEDYDTLFSVQETIWTLTNGWMILSWNGSVIFEPEPKVKAKPKAKPKTKLDAKPKAKPNAKPKAKLKAKLKAKPKAKLKAKPKAKLKAKPKAKLKAKPKAKPKR